jgi:hypothetical protein
MDSCTCTCTCTFKRAPMQHRHKRITASSTRTKTPPTMHAHKRNRLDYTSHQDHTPQLHSKRLHTTTIRTPWTAIRSLPPNQQVTQTTLTSEVHTVPPPHSPQNSVPAFYPFRCLAFPQWMPIIPRNTTSSCATRKLGPKVRTTLPSS